MSTQVIANRLGASVIALAVAWSPGTPALARPLTSDDVALGGVELAKPVTLPADGKFRTVLTIKGVKFKPGESARALLQGALSVRSNATVGNVLIKTRMAVNGIPEEHLFNETIAPQAYASVSIQCNDSPTADETYEYTLQVAVTGSGPIAVGAGTFDLVAFRPIFNPPP